VSESSLSNDPVPQKRRSTRIVQAVPLTVSGTDALGQPFKERTTTVMVNCHGCKYQSKHYVPKNSIVNLEIPRPEPGSKPRQIQGRVVWVQRPRTVRELFQIGLEFENAANVWGIAFPPEDWCEAPADTAGENSPSDAAPATTVGASVQEFKIVPPTAHSMQQAQAPMTPPTSALPGSPKPAAPPLVSSPPSFTIPPPSAQPPVSRVSAPPAPPFAPIVGAPSAKVPGVPSVAPTDPGADSRIRVVPPPALDPQAALARQMARMVTEAKENLDKTLRHDAALAVSEKMSAARQQLDAQLHDAVEKAIQESMARVSETALNTVVKQAADRTLSILEEARKATDASAAQLDDKVRRAVAEAVTQASDHAAKQAAQQTAEQLATTTLKQSVEEAVERALRERQVNTPSLEILASPEAAQQHLNDWKRNLEQTAQSVRARTIADAESDAAAARARWDADFANALTEASQKIAEKAGEISQAAVQQAERDVAERAQGLRASLDEAIASAAARIESIGSGLQQERQRAEEAKQQLQEATESALAKTQQQLDEYLASQYQEISIRAEQVIAERARQIEPAIEATAQRVMDRASEDLAQKLAPQVDQAQKIVADLASARQQADETHAHIKSHLQFATDQAAELKNTIEAHVHAAADQVSTLKDAIGGHVQSAADQVARLKLTADAHVQTAADQVAQLQSSIGVQVQGAAGEIADLKSSVIEQVRQSAEEVKLLQTEIREQIQQATDRADRIQDTIREQAQIASQDAIQASLAHVREETAKLPAEFEQNLRQVTSKVEEDLLQRSSEIQHQNYEAMMKSAEWYQKKAHSTMQTSLERAVEQSTTALRDRAAEVSSLLASELDHYRRTYVEHSTAQIEDAAKEVVSRERDRMSETAQMVTAGFSDQVYRVTSDSLTRFEQTSRAALEKSRSDLEFNREASLLEFQKNLDEKMTEGVDQARQFLQSHMVPMIEQWDAQREAEKKQWMEQLKKSTDESIEAYKARLENTSNSWLLASATTLGQHSQSVLDTIAKAAEKRIRDTCAEVLGGMGDTLKSRLLGLSADYKADDSGEPSAPKKK
jgi:hypothetical protein